MLLDPLHPAVRGSSSIASLQYEQFCSESADEIEYRPSTLDGKPSLRCSVSVQQPQYHRHYYLPPLTEGVYDFLQTTFVPGYKA